MSVADLFSKRKATEAGNDPQLQHTHLPEKFRAQITYLLLNNIGRWVQPNHLMSAGMAPSPVNEAWERIFDTVCQEHGLFALGNSNDSPASQCVNYLMTAGTDATLDLMEYALRFLDQEIRNIDREFYRMTSGVAPDPDAAIREFNRRCRENGVGYSYEQGRLIPAASAFVHTQVVEPALVLLTEEGFRGA